MRRRVDAGEAFVYAVLLTGSVLDAHLIRHDRTPITATLRKPLILVLLWVLTLHASDALGRWDPFRFLAKHLK